MVNTFLLQCNHGVTKFGARAHISEWVQWVFHQEHCNLQYKIPTGSTPISMGCYDGHCEQGKQQNAKYWTTFSVFTLIHKTCNTHSKFIMKPSVAKSFSSAYKHKITHWNKNLGHLPGNSILDFSNAVSES